MPSSRMLAAMSAYPFSDALSIALHFSETGILGEIEAGSIFTMAVCPCSAALSNGLTEALICSGAK